MDALRLLHPSPSLPPLLAGPHCQRSRRHLPPRAFAGRVGSEESSGRRERSSWVLKILRVGSLFAEEEMKRGRDHGVSEIDDVGGDRCWKVDVGCDRCVGCGCGDDDREMAVKFDRDSFSRLLHRVSLSEARIYAKLSYLSGLAYAIPRIKSENLVRRYGLRFVTSSLEKRASSSLDAEQEQKLTEEDQEPEPHQDGEEDKDYENQGKRDWGGISSSAAYQIAASAAAYLQSQARGIFPSWPSEAEMGKNDHEDKGGEEGLFANAKAASFIATKNSVTAVVAGKEETKLAVAQDLRSARTSPCEWYICDDDKSGIRYFVIQGSESLASWQTNLLFEPIQFEGLDVLVHRGIYEAAKGIYEQMLPEVRSQLQTHGGGDSAASLCFTGHSLGGSLSMLVSLMLLIRGEAPRQCLLPVVTFGAPSIMCGGNSLLSRLGLPLSHVQAVMHHRDIVPRAFSCTYPDRVVEILKAINGSFRDHPCLNKQNLLYAPMGKLVILQPEEKWAPYHPLLPADNGLFVLGHSADDTSEEDSVRRRLQGAAWYAFLNSPHPLETLSDRAAYGSNGTLSRDHDVHGYMKSLRSVIREELKLIRRKAKRKPPRPQVWWPLVVSGSRLNYAFYYIYDGGKETWRRLSRLVTSQQHTHLLLMILFTSTLLVSLRQDSSLN